VSNNSGSGRGAHHEVVAAIVGGTVLLAVILAASTRGARPPSAATVPAWLLGHTIGLLGRWTPAVIALGVLLVLGCLAVEVLRWTVLIPRALRSRVAYAILPPPDFDPAPETIEAFGQQLLGARRRVLAWLDGPASAIRIRLTTTADGRLLYSVEIPERFRGTLFNAFATAYPAVDVRPLEDVAGAEAGQGAAASPGRPGASPGVLATVAAPPVVPPGTIARHESREESDGAA
jgi:hypothetical protein